eukprot:Clim_evm9s156 gene=Clim_evmTU9s156
MDVVKQVATNENAKNVLAAIGAAYVLGKVSLKVLELWSTGFTGSGRHVPDRSKAILVTGCDSGFGRQVSLELARLGFSVFSGCLNEENVKALEKEAGKGLTAFVMDVTKEEDIKKAVSLIESKTGGTLHAVINNAGASFGWYLDFTPVSDFRRQLELNTIAVVAVTKACLPMLRKGKGHIVNVASLAGTVSMAGMSAYAASKHAVMALSDGWRREFAGFGIKVVNIEPGFIRTPILTQGSANGPNKLWPEASPELRRMYGGEEHMQYVEKRRQEITKRAADPQVVVDAMVKAVTLKQPATRYVVPREARTAKWMFKTMPDTWIDVVLGGSLTEMIRKNNQ